jgi:hypothetical protein
LGGVERVEEGKREKKRTWNEWKKKERWFAEILI